VNVVALVDALIDKINDVSLRRALREQVDILLHKQSYGLVFQQHEPETVELPNYKVRRGCKVRMRRVDNELYRVDNVKSDKATIVSLTDPPEFRDVNLDAIVVVREFGDPIYPGLRSTGKVERGGDKPAHIIINAENFHALETLLYTHEGAIDAIYIDPPYNTRDKDWKYNNDYVDPDDLYVHSKWLAMMQRRLELAQRLLNPDSSVLIVTIGEKEVLRLGLLLEQIFRDARIQVVSDLINPANVARRGGFGRNDEYIFFVMIGSAAPHAARLGEGWVSEKGRTFTGYVRWDLLRRSGTNARRLDRQKLFYPIFVDVKSRRIVGTGDWLEPRQDPNKVACPRGQAVVWPIRKDGSEGNWQLGPAALMQHVEQGRVRLGGSEQKGYVVYYIKAGEYKKILTGEYPVLGRNPDGSLKLGETVEEGNLAIPGTQWRIPSHDATQYGSRLLKAFLPDRDFPFPKSLYSVEDALRFFVADNPEAVVLDFFAGSGTTAHAVMRLNAQDEGQRRCILVTNNEVSAEEAVALRQQGYQPGDEEWEALGICEHITKPRIEAAVTGRTLDGKPLRGEYKFVNEFPLSEGLEESAEFFNLTYEDPDMVSLGRKFEAIAALLWLKAGGTGARIETPTETWVLPDDAIYGILFDTDRWRGFVDAIISRGETINHLFIVTDSDAAFQQILTETPTGIVCTQLYSDYLQNFEINTKGRA
jgi:adenine-specific DNA-methyltransferase